jgi:SAM-dependent methyltransferase
MSRPKQDDSVDPYAELPELYDLEHANFAEDIALYLQFAEVIGDPILEMGCGTGRVLRPLAVAGHRVTGVDRSAPMLTRARQVLVGIPEPGTVTLFEGSMASADRAPGGPFGLVIFSLNGLMHLPTLAEQREALVAARRALDPRGMLVIDLPNPTPDWLAAFDGRVHLDGTWDRRDGEAVSRFSSSTHSPSLQRIDTELWYDTVHRDGSVQRVRTRFQMRYLIRSELELLLELVGFVEWQIYGTYELDPFDDHSERMLVTAEVTPS